MSHSKYLFIITGSIASYKTLDVISSLKKDGHHIKVVMTQAACQFVTPLTFSAISGGEVYTDLFDAKDPMSHIDLARWADQIIVAPATASYINKLAAGIADDLASNIYLAHDFTKPFLIYPAMNHAMLMHPKTQSSLNSLKDFGIEIKDTEEGILACGEYGRGKLQTPTKIYEEVKQKKIYKKKILITSGGTREAIDGVRHIGNMSSGKTGATIANQLIAQGHDVTFLYAKDSTLPTGAKIKEFISFESLDRLLQTELNNHYDYIFQLAAISDFSVDHLENEKGEMINTNEKISSHENYSIHLKTNPKLIAKLLDYSSNKNICIIGFKLTHTNSVEKQQMAIAKVFKNPGVQFVVHNDLNDIQNEMHKFTLYGPNKKFLTLETKEELANALCELVKDIQKIKNDEVYL